MGNADIGVVGLAVMGQNLVLNMNDHGFKVAVFNRTTSKVDHFIANEAAGTSIVGTYSLTELAAALHSDRPRIILIMVKAGDVVDAFIDQLVAIPLKRGDIIVDGGNSDYRDTDRRFHRLRDEFGIHFVGMGISGGEEGARYGPSIMPGGAAEAWPTVKPIFQAIAAKVGDEVCCQWLGNGGAGHFVKMVHNGIEYGDMQIICETYDLMKRGFKMDIPSIAKNFKMWNSGELQSFLIEITGDILDIRDTDEEFLVEKIRDAAQQKGTGKLTVEAALRFGLPVTLIAEAVFARCVSSLKRERLGAANVLPSGTVAHSTVESSDGVLVDTRKAMYAAKLISYAQGFMLLRAASHELNWELNLGEIALLWRGGCIIRSTFLGDIKKAFDADPNLENLLLNEYFLGAMKDCLPSLRRTAGRAIEKGIPIPCISSAVAFYDSYRTGRLPANLLQAQRDYFGAHQFEREGKEGVFEHFDWTGRGGKVCSTNYKL